MHIDMGICTYIVHASLIRLCHQIIHKHSCRNSENIAASHWRRRGFSINFNNEPASTEGLLASWTPPQTHTMLKRMASTEHIFNAPQNHTVSFFCFLILFFFSIFFYYYSILLLLVGMKHFVFFLFHKIPNWQNDVPCWLALALAVKLSLFTSQHLNTAPRYLCFCLDMPDSKLQTTCCEQCSTISISTIQLFI